MVVTVVNLRQNGKFFTQAVKKVDPKLQVYPLWAASLRSPILKEPDKFLRGRHSCPTFRARSTRRRNHQVQSFDQVQLSNLSYRAIRQCSLKASESLIDRDSPQIARYLHGSANPHTLLAKVLRWWL